MLKAARAKSLGASKEAVAINAAWKGTALLLMQLLPVPAEVHMRLAAGEAAVSKLHVLCRPILLMSGPNSKASRVQSLHHSRLPYWVRDVGYRPTHWLRPNHLPSPAAYQPPKASVLTTPRLWLMMGSFAL